MPIPTEPIGSIPRPRSLVTATASQTKPASPPIPFKSWRRSHRTEGSSRSPTDTPGIDGYPREACLANRRRVLVIVRDHLRPGQRVFIRRHD